MKTRYGRWCLVAVAALAAVGAQTENTETHTPIASRWNYNEHLFPIFRDNCGSCHRDGGIAPMSLVTYQSAYPWAQSIREEILGLRMPPWKAEDGFGDFRNGHALPAQEMDMILEWSSGGYPQGPRSLSPDPVAAPDDWPLGAPDLEIEMPEAFTVDARTSELVRYFVLPVETAGDRFVTGADVRPGAAAIVRDVAIYVDDSGAARALDAAEDGPGFGEPDDGAFPTGAPLALWSPGRPSVRQDAAARRLPAGADIVARVHYRKTWITEGEEFVDRSRIGLYLGDSDAPTVRSMLLSSPRSAGGLTLAFTHEVAEHVTALAVLPEVEVEARDVQVVAVTPGGDRVPMLFLREADAAWPTRYWFDAPIDLPAGTTIEVEALLHPGAEHAPGRSLFGADPAAPIRLVLDYTAGGTPSADAAQD